jgi:hypothetical protein
MPDLHFEHPRLAALYDAGGWSADRDFYLALPGPSPERILDLGCGTELLHEIAHERDRLKESWRLPGRRGSLR